MTSPLRVLHLTGSPTSAFFDDLSRLYASDCLASVHDPALYEPVVAHVSPDGRWRFPSSLAEDDLASAPSVTLAEAVAHLGSLDVDVALPQMFCLAGMTHYRALLDVLGIPYVGNRPDVMALGAHKGRARAVVAAAGVDVPEGETLRAGQEPTLAPPVVVKPVDADNSVGVTLVRTPEEYPAALAAAWDHGPEALVERFVEPGREVRCGVVERGDDLLCLPLEEYSLDAKPVREEADKIRRGDDGALALMAKDTPTVWIVDRDDPVCVPVWEAARACHVALGCRDYSLFDFRIDPDGRPWFLEAGLYNSFARQSVVATMARADGVELPELFARAVDGALEPGR
ncbi:D-alanine--D-alanine ligase family protein [Solicola sp. PLA-1-18]|uniref:D-alanine--D-alanine ligase family protein n=1 Tax=Solicola sp. PLA-1-18 TaxID=3380532 RepID=UPI003B7D714E